MSNVNTFLRGIIAVSLGIAVSLPALADGSRRQVQSFRPQADPPPVTLPMFFEGTFTGTGSSIVTGGSTFTSTNINPPVQFSFNPNQVPEPGSLALGGIMLAGIAALRRRRK